jgi:hypothetical protein
MDPVTAFVRRNVADKAAEEALSVVRSRALPLEAVRTERSREQQRRLAERRREAAAAARRLPRATRKALRAQSAHKVTYAQLAPLRAAWKARHGPLLERWAKAARATRDRAAHAQRAPGAGRQGVLDDDGDGAEDEREDEGAGSGGASASASTSGRSGAPGPSLSELAADAQTCRRAVAELNMLGADVKVLRAGGAPLRRCVVGTVLDLSAGALHIVTRHSHLVCYPRLGTHLELQGDHQLALWADALPAAPRLPQ